MVKFNLFNIKQPSSNSYNSVDSLLDFEVVKQICYDVTSIDIPGVGMETVVAVVACPSVVIAPVDIAVVVCDWEVDAVGGGNVVVDVVVATT